MTSLDKKFAQTRTNMLSNGNEPQAFGGKGAAALASTAFVYMTNAECACTWEGAKNSLHSTGGLQREPIAGGPRRQPAAVPDM